MEKDLVALLNILSTGTVSTLCLWLVWTDRVKTSTPTLFLVFCVWLATLFGLESVTRNPASMPFHATVVYTALAVFGLYHFYRIQVCNFTAELFGVYLPGYVCRPRVGWHFAAYETRTEDLSSGETSAAISRIRKGA